MLTRDQELWGLALWVEKHHGGDGHDFIRARIERLENEAEDEGVKLWRRVEGRFRQLRATPIPIHGQPQTHIN